MEATYTNDWLCPQRCPFPAVLVTRVSENDPRVWSALQAPNVV